MDSFFNDINQELDTVEEIPMGDASVPTPTINEEEIKPIDEISAQIDEPIEQGLPAESIEEPTPVDLADGNIPTDEACESCDKSDISEIMDLIVSLGNKLAEKGLIKNFNINYEVGDNTLVDTDEAVPVDGPVPPAEVFGGEEPETIDTPAIEEPIAPAVDGEPPIAEPEAVPPVNDQPMVDGIQRDLVKSELDTLDQLDGAKAAIEETDVENKEEIVKTIEEIKEDEIEHIEELENLLSLDTEAKEEKAEDDDITIESATPDDLDNIDIYCKVYDIPEPEVSEEGTVIFRGLTDEQKEIIKSRIIGEGEPTEE